MTWATQSDAALRRAAAGVMGWGQCGIWWAVGGKKGSDGMGVVGIDYWKPDQNRDDLARVFAAAKSILMGRDFPTRSLKRLRELWLLALTDPRAALCGLLDLLQIPEPEQTK